MALAKNTYGHGSKWTLHEWRERRVEQTWLFSHKRKRPGGRNAQPYTCHLRSCDTRKHLYPLETLDTIVVNPQYLIGFT